MLKGPLSQCGDTAANTGMLALLDSYESTANLPISVKTLGASGAAAAFRIVLMPVDALKTTLQVEGGAGLSILASKIRVGAHSHCCCLRQTIGQVTPKNVCFNHVAIMFIGSKYPQNI